MKKTLTFTLSVMILCMLFCFSTMAVELHYGNDELGGYGYTPDGGKIEYYRIHIQKPNTVFKQTQLSVTKPKSYPSNNSKEVVWGSGSYRQGWNYSWGSGSGKSSFGNASIY